MRSVQAELVEQNSRSKNVVIHGLADNNSADEDMKNLSDLFGYLKVKVKILKSRRLAAFRQNQRKKRPLLLILNTVSDKDAIRNLQSSSSLWPKATCNIFKLTKRLFMAFGHPVHCGRKVQHF